MTVARPPEGGLWLPFGAGWRQIYGSFEHMGVSIELHDIRLQRELEWGRSFHPGSVEICLNLEGNAWFAHGAIVGLAPAQSVVYSSGEVPLAAYRAAGERHRFVTVELSPAFLRSRLAGCEDALLPFVAGAMRNGVTSSAVAQPRQFTASQSATVRSVLQPPVAPQARALWHEARLLEWLAECLYSEDSELFCHRQQRVERERVEKVRAFIVADIERTPALAEIAAKVGMSPFYLSRTFSRLTGETIPQFLRRVRVERAAEMLIAGTHNVTEAAFAVGYSSLGHFSKAFTELLGCTPSVYVQGRTGG